MDVIRVGPFELHASERMLCENGRPVDLGARAFDLLLVLTENAGKLVSKATLLERVWPRLVVDENNLPAQIAALRRILGAGAIRTVPGFGYRLEMSVGRATAPGVDPPEAPGGVPEPARLPVTRRTWRTRLTPIIGRAEDVLSVEASLGEASIVTIVGPAGVGKTRLAEEVLSRGVVAPADGAALVALSAIDTAAQVPPAIALALGLSLVDTMDGFLALERALGQAPLLLVLDNAEHLAASLSRPLEGLLSRAPGLRLLVTSQTPLGVAGEIVYRLAPLAVPAAGSPTDVAASSPAVALFAQRAAAADRNFRLTPTSAGVIGDICRRLDGNPLALELAAARVPALGVAALHDRLDDRFRLLKLAGHQADPRHGALNAAFDWSYSLLSASEQKVFDRLGAFAGTFSLEAAARCVSDADIDATDAIDLISRLVDRSLVNALPGEPPRYSLLETARYYALERLRAKDELDHARTAMAATTLHQLDVAYREYWDTDEAIWLQHYAPELDNVRAAMDWASTHDRQLGVALYGSSWPLFVEAELFTEARARYEPTLRLLTDTLPKARLGRFWEAVAAYDSTRQCDRARFAAELSATMHADTDDVRSRYFALMQLALNWRSDNSEARAALAQATALADPSWPPRLLTHGALTESALLIAARDFEGARSACRRAIRLALTVSERQALAATVKVVELDLACGDTSGALQLGRPLAESLRHSGRHATRLELLTLNFTALLLSGELDEARSAGAEIYGLGVRLDPAKLYTALDAMAYLACMDARYEIAARVASYADFAHEAHGLLARRPTDNRLREDVVARLERHIGPAWREVRPELDPVHDEISACALALGL